MKTKYANYTSLAFVAATLILSLTSGFVLSKLGWHVNIDLDNTNLSPTYNFTSIHSLGTDFLGRDVLSLIVHSAKYSLIISIASGILAIVIGTLIGGVSGILGDDKVQLRRSSIINALLIFIILWFYTSVLIKLYSGFIVLLITFLILLVAIGTFKIVNKALNKVPWFNEKISFPFDLLNNKLIEVVYAVPIYFVLLGISAFMEPSVSGLILVIGFTSWPQTSILVRAEVLKLRDQDFVTSLKLSGISNVRIFVTHIIPNSYQPALVNLTFIMASLLVIESTLSFIGIGLPGDLFTWGKILSGFKHNTSNWWTILFPGLFIFLTIISLHRIGNWIRMKI